VRDPITIDLSEPITVIDRVVAQLVIQPPKGKHIQQAGYPLAFDQTGSTQIIGANMGRLIALCAGITSTAVEDLPLEDWNACAQALMGFLAPASATSSTDTSSALASGATT
jgi:hypothetical protein